MPKLKLNFNGQINESLLYVQPSEKAKEDYLKACVAYEQGDPSVPEPKPVLEPIKLSPTQYLAKMFCHASAQVNNKIINHIFDCKEDEVDLTDDELVLMKLSMGMAEYTDAKEIDEAYEVYMKAIKEALEED